MRKNHDHHDHSGGSRSRIGWAAVLTGSFMVAEAVGGLISGSLALLADAGHMAVDFAGLALAYFAIVLAARPATATRTFGYQRLPVLIAFSNGLVLFFIAAWIIVEAVRRLNAPVEILAGPMLAVAIGGLIVNVVAFVMLHGGDQEDLNLRGALLHVMGDLLGSVAAIAASVTILATGWTPIDPILSVFVSLIILGNAYRLVKASAHILLEGAPAGVDPSAMRSTLAAAVPGLSDIHHVHVWTIAPKKLAATLHARLENGTDAALAVHALKRELASAYGISHATIEVETGDGPCADGARREDGCMAGPGHDAHSHDDGHRHSQGVVERHSDGTTGRHSQGDRHRHDHDGAHRHALTAAGAPA